MSEPITKQRLMEYISLRMETDHQLERIERMRAEEQFPSMREPDGSQHTGGGGNRMAGAIIRRMEYEERVRPQIEENNRKMAEIEEAINRMPNPMEREVLRLRYIDGGYCRHMAWGDIAVRIYGDNDERCLLATYRLHQKALSNIKKMGR